MTRPLRVRGGAYSIAAQFDRLTFLADRFSALERLLMGRALQSAEMQLGIGLLASSFLDPFGAWQVREHLMRVTAFGASSGVAAADTSRALRAAVGAYREAEKMFDRLEPAVAALTQLPGALSRLRPGNPASLGAALEADPEVGALAMQAVNLATSDDGLVPPRIVRRSLAEAFEDGSPVVTRAHDRPVLDARSPRNLSDVIAGLELRNEHNAGGAVDVRLLRRRRPDGELERLAIVDITGTTSWSITERSSVVSDLETNLREFSDAPSTYASCVLEAMHLAGVEPDMPVMLVGHSQGGMVALDVARRAVADGSFAVTHVVTAGSPVAEMSVPAQVQVLSLENAGDLVPQIDGALNPATSGHVTVTVDHGGPSPLDRHDLSAYREGASDVDRATDRGIRAWLAGASAFFSADEIHTQVFHASRRL